MLTIMRRDKRLSLTSGIHRSLVGTDTKFALEERVGKVLEIDVTDRGARRKRMPEQERESSCS